MGHIWPCHHGCRDLMRDDAVKTRAHLIFKCLGKFIATHSTEAFRTNTVKRTYTHTLLNLFIHMWKENLARKGFRSPSTPKPTHHLLHNQDFIYSFELQETSVLSHDHQHSLSNNETRLSFLNVCITAARSKHSINRSKYT